MIKKDESKSEDLNKAIKILKKGGVVIFPTDTVYGIGCVWNNKMAVTRIKKIKKSDQNFPILISNLSQLHQIARVSGPAQELINRFWPGALTLILTSKHDFKKIGIRMPNSKVVKVLIESVGPIIGTSANFHTKETPKTYADLSSDFTNLADFTIKGRCDLEKESTVIDATVVPFKILRQGALNVHESYT